MTRREIPKPAKTRKVIDTLSNIPRAVKLIWAAGRGWAVLQAVLIVARGLIPAALVYLTKAFTDAIIVAVKDGSNPGNVGAILWLAVLFGGSVLLSEILGSIVQMVYTAQGEALTDHIFDMIHEKAVQADLAYYEQPEFFDHLHRARNQAYTRPQELNIQLGSLLQNTVSVISISLIVIRYGIWLPLLLFLIALPSLYVVLASSARMHSWQKGRTADERLSLYFDRVLTNVEYAAELRLFGLGEYFRGKFGELRAGLRSEKIRLSVRQRIFEFSANLIALSLTAAVFGWILRRTLNGGGTIGDLALFYQVFNQGQSLLKSFLGDAGRLYSNGLFLADLFEFLDLEPQIASPEQPTPTPRALEDGINIENVTFRYSNGRGNTLTNFSMYIPANKVVAVVGENGAGKSTLLKLICRFYDPQKGAIRFDGADLRSFSLDELRSMITVLFQTPVRYGASVGENIALGDVEKLQDIGRVEQAARAAGAEQIVEKLPKGYEQLLGLPFSEGGELSVGEWQRLALARAVFRDAPLVLLDEPTSAMDPWAEGDWLKTFAKHAEGKTVLIITHRPTTAMLADLIYVMKNGEILESGTHSELLAKGGRYADSWKLQSVTRQFESTGGLE